MIFGVNKKSFFLYTFVFITGILLIILSVFFYGGENTFLYDAFLGIGCSSIPTALTAFFVDLVNERNKTARKNKLRKSLLKGFPYGVAYISNCIVKKFYNGNKGVSLLDAFNEAIDRMKDCTPNEYEEENYAKLRERMNESFEYGINLSIPVGEHINNERFSIEANDIFSGEEITAIKTFCDECKKISSYYRIDDMGEAVGLNVNSIINSIPEVKKSFESPVK